MRRHVKARFKWNNVTRIQETVSTDPLFSNVRSAYDGYIGARSFMEPHHIVSMSMASNLNETSIKSIKISSVNMEHLPFSEETMPEKKTMMQSNKSKEIYSLKMNSLSHITLCKILWNQELSTG